MSDSYYRKQRTNNSRTDQDNNWRKREKETQTTESKEPACRYCKQTGHLIKDCPTRPPRRQPHDKRPIKKTSPPASPKLMPNEMFWPSLNSDKDIPAVELRGDWGAASLLDKLKDSSDSESTLSEN